VRPVLEKAQICWICMYPVAREYQIERFRLLLFCQVRAVDDDDRRCLLQVPGYGEAVLCFSTVGLKK
jgi:hypothetical protein